jgi:hypothetical protein
METEFKAPLEDVTIPQAGSLTARPRAVGVAAHIFVSNEGPCLYLVQVVGDVHGQLADVLTIFRLNGIPDRSLPSGTTREEADALRHAGMPSESRRYIFNGDFVDRGSHGVEVALLLFALKLVDKHSLYLNRGNHECRRMNERYSFEV